jgi:XTP/dITP diphosphohydrolase
MGRLLLASGNKGKVREMQAILSDLSAQILTLEQIGIGTEVEESGRTYAENAMLKAKTYANRTGLLTIGDDSGLEVEALHGAPGIYSARFSPKPGASDSDRRRLLIETLKNIPRPWRARFRCTIAIASPAGEIHFADGECPGEIVPEERGNNGFGYDPIFLITVLNKTMAELPTEVKNRISHRARALRAALPLLTKLITIWE